MAEIHKTVVEEVLEPNTDPRRLAHLRRSDDAFARTFDPEPIRDLPDRSNLSASERDKGEENSQGGDPRA